MMTGARLRAVPLGCLLLGASIGLVGCTPDETAEPPTAPASSTPTPGTGTSAEPQSRDAIEPISTGMEVRTVNPDGSVSTIEVRDFPR